MTFHGTPRNFMDKILVLIVEVEDSNSSEVVEVGGSSQVEAIL